MFLALLLAGATVDDQVLQSAFTAAHRDFMAKLTDQFAEETADPGAIGREFRYVAPIGDGNGYGNSSDAYFTFKEGKLRLIFIADEEYAGPGIIEGPKYVVGKLRTSRQAKRTYTGTNAFGVSANVRVSRMQEDLLAMLERPEGEANPYSTSSGYSSIDAIISRMPKRSYWVELALPGPEARKVAQDVALVIEGRIAPLVGGKLNICKSNYISPTIDTPVEIYGSKCMVGANVRRIAYVRKSTGEVVREWTTPAADATP